MKDDDRLQQLREQVERVDGAIVDLVVERRELVRAIWLLKEKLGLPLLDPMREADVLMKTAARARRLGLPEDSVEEVIRAAMNASR